MTKLLIIDDSPLMRRLLGELFNAESDFEVAFARDGHEGLAALGVVQPDVITLDIEMPRMGGLECLDRIMVERPTPVVMASALTAEGADEALKAMALGAVDFIAKPAGAVSLRMDEFGPPLIAKVRAAATARLSNAKRLRERVRLQSQTTPTMQRSQARPRPRHKPSQEGLVLIGASTGGPPALDAVLGPLAGDFPWPIVIAQHMPAAFTGPLARRLNGLTALTVEELSEFTLLQPGHAYVARGDADVIFSRRDGRLAALPAPSSATHRWHPSVGRMVDSARTLLGAEQLVGVLLTGMGDDGAAAMAALHTEGGHTIAESEETAVVFGMPRMLCERGGASEVAPLHEVAARLAAAVHVL